MVADEEQPEPLTSEAVSRLEPLAPEEKPPEKVTLTLAALALPRGAEASLVKARGAGGNVRVQVELPGRALGRRPELGSIRTIALDPKKLRRARRRARPEGARPPYFPVRFFPEEIPLLPHERAHPPFDFDFRRDKELLDRPTNVFAPDGRYIYQDTTFPWCTVGRVDTPLGWCTGCTIGSRLLLTGNHCIQWNPDNTAGWVQFRPAFYNGSAPFGEAWATRVIFWTRVNGGDGVSDQETAFDYVVCELDRRMGDVVGYAGYRTYSTGWNGGAYWQHMGYPNDLSGGQRPAFQGSASVTTATAESTAGQTSYVLGHFNDVVGGHSGGPVWGWWIGEPWPRVVGAQSAEASVPANNTSGDNEFGGGAALSSLISWARSNYA